MSDMIPNNPKIKSIKYWKFIIGVMFVGVGLHMLSLPDFLLEHSNNLFDSLEGRGGVPVHTHIIALGGIIIGTGFILSAFSRKSIDPEAKNDLICINCGATFKTIMTVKYKCKKCKGNLEGIKGVFDRHPDLLSKIKPVS